MKNDDVTFWQTPFLVPVADDIICAVLAELFCQKSPIFFQFIAKFARFLAQYRGKFATFSWFSSNLSPNSPGFWQNIAENSPLLAGFQVLLHFYALTFLKMDFPLKKSK